MISKIARLRAKKGFTIVELIVVIAIIGILTSLIVAAFSYDRRPAIGKAMAKDYFYKIQDCLANVRVGFPNAFDSSLDKIDGFYFEIDSEGRPNVIGSDANGDLYEWGTFVKSGTSGSIITTTTLPRLSEVSHAGTPADDRNAMEVRLLETFIKYVSSADNMSGTLYVDIDGFKVKSAYWTDSAHVFGGTGLLVADSILDTGYYYCAYPIQNSFEGAHAFSDI